MCLLMIKKQFREFLKTVGMEEDVTDEMLDEMIEQMSKMLEFDNIGNSINIKTGFIIHQLILKNTSDVKVELAEQLRKGTFVNKLPPLQFQLVKTCLQLNDDGSCSLLKQWNRTESRCIFTANFASCELARGSNDQGLEEFK